MSDDFHRPTLTFPTGAYNATQVRLYGKFFALQPIDEFFKFVTDNSSIPEAEAKKLGKAAKDCVKAAGRPTQISYIRLDFKELGLAFVAALPNNKNDKKLSAGVIVGYAYEGHCYDLPKPKVMLLSADPLPVPSDDCGYDLKNRPALGNMPAEDNQYRVWIVDKLDECIEFDMNQGFVEQLVLEANLPGKRSPTMYAGKMMLGHRSGRLSE